MSNFYAIKDSTLTALGDAVRSKVIGVETPEETIEQFFQYGGGNSTKTITASLQAPKYKIICDNFIINGSGNFVWTVYDGDKTQLYQQMFSVNNPLPLPLEFDINYQTFEITGYVADPGETLTATITIIPLDENGNEFKYTPLEMADKINGLMTIPDEALNLTGDCQYRFAYGSNDWLINMAGDKITTKNIYNANYMFSDSKELEAIPFEINLKNNTSIEYMFQHCYKLKAIPQVNMNITNHIKFGHVFFSCMCMRDIPEWLIDLLEADYNLTSKNSTFAPWIKLFDSCTSLRVIPDRVMKVIRNDNMSSNYYGVAYCKPFSNCNCLDELVNVWCDNYTYTSNQFGYFFDGLGRAKNITFAANDDGTIPIRQWKSQTIDLTKYVGWIQYATTPYSYNSGITADKEVTDDATYQALKDDPDWFSCDINYSRYNHDSAVNTINSLPDCSASGTNTIKFSGAAGALTDGGAINTLTEEEIAVAAAKGWTVSLV